MDRPCKDATPSYTAHHMLVFTLMSLELFRPFVPENARSTCPFWEVWVQQVYIIQSLMKPGHTYNELLALDKAIHKLFTTIDQIPEYNGFWVPKFHFAQHAAMDVLRYGPMRLNWCMMYEAKNQPLKRGCKRSNFHNPAKSTAEFWATSTDHQIRKRHKRTPSMSAGPVKKQGTSDTFPELADELSYMHTALELEPDATFKMLRSAGKYGVQFFSATYAIIGVLPGVAQETICRIQHIIQANNGIYLLVDVFPPDVIHYDEMGVMRTTIAELKKSPTTYMVLNLEKDPLTALWHFTEKHTTLSFVAKW